MYNAIPSGFMSLIFCSTNFNKAVVDHTLKNLGVAFLTVYLTFLSNCLPIIGYFVIRQGR